ncbi:tail fiber domain-containing protein, partial [Candidatus Dojkabacteria bacterium]|nr:tail fiber domain-containing protein [Candidatus Dojkabacteria bacterium]
DGAVSMQGQMGIGTTTPQYPLDLRSTTATILQNNSLTNSGASAVTGIYNNVYSTNTSGTKSTATGVESLVTQTGAGGTITDAYGVRGRVEGNAGTINNAYGLYATVTAPSGTINNAYGLYVDTVEETGTGSAYGIYVKDSQSYFGNNVGIGTTTPSSMVHIYGNSAASSRLTLTRSDVDSDEMYMGMVSRGGIKMLDIGGATTATIAATFTEDGSVGIGTTNPYSKLEIKDGSVYLSDSDVSQPITGAWPATTYGFLTPINGTAGGLWLTGLSDTDATATRISGIMGTNNPTDSVPAVSFTASKYNTSVSTQALGNTETAFQFTNESSVITTIYGNGNMTIGGSLTQNSDERLKTNIQNLTDGVSILNQIRPVSYILKKTDENNYGVIAQEVEKILPELVLTSPADGIKSVNYIGFIPFLIKATQEQQSSINILQNDINKLKAQIASISGTPSGTTPLEFSEYLEVVSLKVTGLVDFGENTVGIATVPAGETEIAIEFTESYTTPPIITVTPEGQEYLDSGLTYTIIDKTEDGFTIKLSDIYTEDLLFNWHVFE